MRVHAVYHAVSQEQIIKLTVDQILSRDPTKDSKAFAQEIGKYIDSKDQKRGDKKEKNAKEKKDKDKGKSIIEKLREQNNKRMGTGNGSQDKSHDLEEPAFWPLIRQVQVQCNAGALSTGAILVDLPGVADANAARNNIAKDYMKKCDCIWILAPITRAVDDKTARDLMGDAFKMQLMMDGNYDDHAITFIATKCDDVSCSEVIRALNLDDDPALVEIEDEIDACNTEMDEHKGKKKEAESTAKEIDQGLKQLREFLAEYQDHLKAMENGETFVPKLTAKTKAGKNAEDSGSRGKKRKNSRGDEDDDFLVDDDDDLDFSGSESDKNSGDESDGDKSESGSNKDSGDEEDDEEDQEAEEATEESLKEKIEEAKNGIKEFRVHLSEARKLRKEAMDALAGLKKRQNKAQREKNAFCSLKRSEFSRDVLKEDFRIGLKDLDDAAAEQRDPDSFDPTLNIRNYEEIDLPVFTCSSRDYVRLKGQVKGDGDPACFTKFEDTGIPELQKWCHQLTVSSRERAARNFMTHLKTFATSVKGYVQGIGDVTVADRDALREKWESILPDDDDDDEADPFGGFGGGWASSDDPFDLPGLAELANPLGNALYTMQNKAPKVDRFGELVGITPRLVKDFMKVIDDCVHELQKSFRDGLEEKCRVGAINAAAAALETSDNFAASMHWGTYRATLRRHGSWRQDLNVELSNPFTRQIASSWSKVFEADLFSGFEKATKEAIKKVLKEVEESAALGLKERAKGQAEQALEEARVALEKTLGLVRDTINTEQKEVSRCLAPHIRNQLVDDYNAAMAERGKGSVARQKALFHDAISDTKSEMFDGAADVIMGRLAKAAEAVGKALEGSLSELAETVEVSVAVLWEGVKDDPAQVKVRTEVISSVAEIIEQIRLWQEAARQKQTTSA
ncbi:hypothetical protein EW026_g6853 [Hermanssonia centrifuga]|uniref:Nuclear GTPase SLIP-GC n=1 Tax=Hermanssonia centrifuga TaxID=98765 RepID=A0A4S4K9N6_9APHY|nr:hypothetical protein EW026_g6853 [Hermanssonia centrifuga]